jgi:hypothetical protein
LGVDFGNPKDEVLESCGSSDMMVCVVSVVVYEVLNLKV